MKSRSSLPFVVVLLRLFAASAAHAQPSPAPPVADEDLEVPAAPAPTPPPSTPPATSAPVAPAETPEQSKIAALERRLAALEVATAKAPAAPVQEKAPKDAPSAAAPGLSRSPFSLPMPEGLAAHGYVQADYLHSQASDDQLQQSGSVLNQNRFYLRRARLRLDHGWKYASGTVELEASTVATPTVGIRRAEASLYYQGDNPREFPPLAALTAGITDLPFGYELFEQDRVAPFVERSLVSSALFPTKQDAGVKVHGALAFLRYAFMVSNGEPVDAKGFPRDPNDAKDVTGRVGVVVPIRERFEVTGGASFAEGKGFHPGTAATKGGVTWTDANENGIIDNTSELTPAFPKTATPSGNFERWAFGLDLGFRLRTSLGETHVFGEVIAASNYDRGFLASDPLGAVSADVRQLGGYAAVTQDVTDYGIVGVRLSVYDPNADILETRRGKLEPKTQTVRTISPMIGLRLPGRARFVFQYDFIHDYLGRNALGVPTDAKNNQYTARLQVDL